MSYGGISHAGRHTLANLPLKEVAYNCFRGLIDNIRIFLERNNGLI